MTKTHLIYFVILLLVSSSCKKENNDKPTGSMQLFSVKAGSINFTLGSITTQIPVESSFSLSFSAALDQANAEQNILLKKDNQTVPTTATFSSDGKEITLTLQSPLEYVKQYKIIISSALRGAAKESFPGFEVEFQSRQAELNLVNATINGLNFRLPQRPKGINYQQAIIVLTFSEPLKNENLTQHFSFSPLVEFTIGLSQDKRVVTVTTSQLDYYRKHFFIVSSGLQAENGANYAGFSNQFITGLNPNPKMPPLDDEALLDLVQERTFRYFWDFAHPASGLARERNSSGDLVTTGGSGFGLMGIIVGVERGFITRQQAVAHFGKVTNFLQNADRFHGVWPHWLNGNTGRTIAFSTFDNGADLVETSFLAAGLICVRQYLNDQQPDELLIINRINTMLDEIEWNWFTRGGQDALYWHWSPNHGWAMNMKVTGYNEALITHFLAAASLTHPVPASVYHAGWARNGNIINGKSFYGLPLPVGYDFGGPLFFAHYSFVGLDPRNLSDQYANYWTQNVNHSLINWQHSIHNPRGHLGYSADSWGLTASDDPSGYRVHEPSNDNGTITPTAALSSMPFSPEASMLALRHFYFVLGDKLWGQYGFYDAFNPSEAWWANSYLAIDQGPILVMIENHRSGLCWNLFMSAPETQRAMNKLGFTR